MSVVQVQLDGLRVTFEITQRQIDRWWDWSARPAEMLAVWESHADLPPQGVRAPARLEDLSRPVSPCNVIDGLTTFQQTIA